MEAMDCKYIFSEDLFDHEAEEEGTEMSTYRDRKAVKSPFVESLPALVEMAIFSRKVEYGWVNGTRFCVAYPGGRTVYWPQYKRDAATIPSGFDEDNFSDEDD
jgi:hypothetical protein